jgi:hypothetical protein
MQLNMIEFYETNTELQEEFIKEVTANLNSIRISSINKDDFELGYAVLSYLIDKHKLENRALQLISFYKSKVVNKDVT